MNIIKKNLLKDKEENMLTTMERAFVENAISLLAVEDVIVNNLGLEEIYDCEGFFNRHQKRIGAVLDVLRGLFAVGFSDEEMLAKFKTLHWEHDKSGKERLASMIKAFSEDPKAVDEATMEILERILDVDNDPVLSAIMRDTEEEKQMVRCGELLGEYRVENFERGEYVEQTA